MFQHSFRHRLALVCGWLLCLLVAACTAPSGAPATPSLQFGGPADGCGDLFVYRPNEATTEYVTVWVSAESFRLSTTPTTVDLTQSGDDLAVTIDVYAGPVREQGEFPYCNDVAPMAEPIAVWRAVAGSATVTLSADRSEFRCSGPTYQATVALTDVRFANGDASVTLDRLTFDNVTVGWCSG